MTPPTTLTIIRHRIWADRTENAFSHEWTFFPQPLILAVKELFFYLIENLDLNHVVGLWFGVMVAWIRLGMGALNYRTCIFLALKIKNKNNEPIKFPLHWDVWYVQQCKWTIKRCSKTRQVLHSDNNVLTTFKRQWDFRCRQPFMLFTYRRLFRVSPICRFYLPSRVLCLELLVYFKGGLIFQTLFDKVCLPSRSGIWGKINTNFLKEITNIIHLSTPITIFCELFCIKVLFY